MFVVFDLDGTLALNEHRQHFIDRPVGQKDWDSFHAACGLDRVNWQVAEVARAIHVMGNRVSIWKCFRMVPTFHQHYKKGKGDIPAIPQVKDKTQARE